MFNAYKQNEFEFYDFKNNSKVCIIEAGEEIQIENFNSLTYKDLTFKIDKIIYFKGACLSAYLNEEKVLTITCNKVELSDNHSGGLTIKIQNVHDCNNDGYIEAIDYTIYLSSKENEEFKEFKEGELVVSKDKIEKENDMYFIRYNLVFNIASMKDEDIVKFKSWDKVPTRKELYDMAKIHTAFEVIRVDEELLLVKNNSGKTFYITRKSTYKFDDVINEGEKFGRKIRELLEAKNKGKLDEHFNNLSNKEEK